MPSSNMRNSSSADKKTLSRKMSEDMFSSISIKSPKIDRTPSVKLFSESTSETPLSKLGRLSLNSTPRVSAASWKSTGAVSRVAFLLTCLQFGCAMYATFLFFLSPTSMPDIMTEGPEAAAWLLAHGQRSRLDFPTSTGAGSSEQQMVRRVSLELHPEPKSAVCETEEIAFEQKKSNNTRMIDIKTSLFRSVIRAT